VTMVLSSGLIVRRRNFIPFETMLRYSSYEGTRFVATPQLTRLRSPWQLNHFRNRCYVGRHWGGFATLKVYTMTMERD
jgi:hypothetical protein